MNITQNYTNFIGLYRQPGHCGGPAGSPAKRDHEPSDGMSADRVTLSAAAKTGTPAGPAMEKPVTSEQDLSNAQRQAVNDLKQRDLEVKAHEQAHMAAGGPVVQGGATYQYQTGPDGKLYAVGGEVKIDVSPERTPEATIRKMQQIRRAALAPAQPSSTDRAVAAQALQIEAQARMEKNEAAQSEVSHNTLQDPDRLTETEASSDPRHQTNQGGGRIDILA